MNFRKYYDTKLVVLFTLCLFDLVDIIKSNEFRHMKRPPCKCKMITECPSMMNEFNKYKSANPGINLQTIFYNSICGKRGHIVMVCCIISPMDKPQQYVQQPSKDVPANISECGIRRTVTARIVNGVQASPGAYPWIATLFHKVNGGKLVLSCGGSLISDKYVITAAHCHNPPIVLVRLGAYDISNPSEVNARDFRIKRIVVHENFNRPYQPKMINDISLIELSPSAPRTNFIIPICLPDSSNFNAEGSQPFIAGWGKIYENGPIANVMRHGPANIYSRRRCEYYIPGFEKKGIICAGALGVGVCSGDSGGPLMVPKEEKGLNRYYLLGITSSTTGCDTKQGPDYYVSVVHFLPWIRKHMI